MLDTRQQSPRRRPAMVACALMLIALCPAAVAQSGDDGFAPSANGILQALSVDADDRLLVGGGFTHVNGALHPYLARINVDGSVEASVTAAPNNDVRAITVLPNPSALIGGAFNTISATPSAGIAQLIRVTPVAQVSPSFAFPVAGERATVNSVVLQDDGKLVFGGSFTTVAGQARTGLASTSESRAAGTNTATPTRGTGGRHLDQHARGAGTGLHARHAADHRRAALHGGVQ